MGENELEVAEGLESRDLAGEVVFPVGLLLDLSDNGLVERMPWRRALAEGESRVLGAARGDVGWVRGPGWEIGCSREQYGDGRREV